MERLLEDLSIGSLVQLDGTVVEYAGVDAASSGETVLVRLDPEKPNNEGMLYREISRRAIQERGVRCGLFGEEYPFQQYLAEKAALKGFFGRDIEVPGPTETMVHVLRKAKELHWDQAEAHFWSGLPMPHDAAYPGWKIRPSVIYWEFLNEHYQLSEHPSPLTPHWFVIDGIQKPQLRNTFMNAQMYENDRADRLKIDRSRVRFPTVMEFSLVGNTWHQEWGETDSREWLYEAYERTNEEASLNRLIGGSSNTGGIADILFGGERDRIGQTGFRPLIMC